MEDVQVVRDEQVTGNHSEAAFAHASKQINCLQQCSAANGDNPAGSMQRCAFLPLIINDNKEQKLF